mgnify:CR=1 FL=1
MKYFDKSTRKISANWHQRQFENDESKQNLKIKNLFKKRVRNFSYKIEDKIWWNALTEKEQIEAFREYYNGTRYWYSWSSLGKINGYGEINCNFDISNGDEVISDEEHKKRIIILKERFIPQTNRRRNLVISEILS